MFKIVVYVFYVNDYFVWETESVCERGGRRRAAEGGARRILEVGPEGVAHVLGVYVCTLIYIYIYIERERYTYIHRCVYIYIYI